MLISTSILTCTDERKVSNITTKTWFALLAIVCPTRLRKQKKSTILIRNMIVTEKSLKLENEM